ncbi:uncharacterized protein LOC121386635 [Gigantopelta aegis]|uniref:uncharacterized protein LOC121386635 n=1 Tax=Gigantopelta aegis TaxID=1735272 RepID=UPI001B888F3C|nr:uncharacterized protein LOC121386635 [Gigantopelta aegis]
MSATGCSICFDSFSRPVTCIPCGHVFCQNCIAQWEYTSDERGCPHCRKRIDCVQRIIWDDNNIYLDCKKTAQTELGDIVQEKVVWVKEKTFDIMGYVKKEIRLFWRRTLKFAHVETLGQLPGQAKALWNSLGGDVQFFIFFLLVLILSLVVQDANNEGGIIQGCLRPIWALLVNVVSHLLYFLLHVFTRPILCVGLCLREVLFMLWDLTLGLMFTLFAVLKDLISIPVVLIQAVGNGIMLLLNFTAEVVMTIVRLVFVFALCCVVFLLARPDPQIRVYVDRFCAMLLGFWTELRGRQEAT